MAVGFRGDLPGPNRDRTVIGLPVARTQKGLLKRCGKLGRVSLEHTRSVTASVSQSEADTKARIPARSRHPVAIPGLWPALAVVGVCGLLTDLWAIPRLAEMASTKNPDAPAELADVASSDLDAAFATMNLSSGAASQLRTHEGRCTQPLAWVSIARAPGSKEGKVRLLSGSYASPVFALKDGPQRVAIPFPAPYQSGHGTISVLSDTGSAIVALFPAWHIQAEPGRASHEVAWKPTDCAKGAP